MKLFVIIVLLALVFSGSGCSIVEPCEPCVQEGCYFVTLSNGVICLDAVDGIVDVLSITQPYSPEYCSEYVYTTTTTPTTTITTTTSITTTTTEAPDGVEISWPLILLFSFLAFVLFLIVGFFLYRGANLKYKRHRDTLISSDLP